MLKIEIAETQETILVPERADVDNAAVGMMLPGVFGAAECVRIAYRGINAKGKAFVGYELKFGGGSTITGGMVEGEYIATLSTKANHAQIWNALRRAGL